MALVAMFLILQAALDYIMAMELNRIHENLYKNFLYFTNHNCITRMKINNNKKECI
jgi:hypothetical protein